jgi:homoserine O-acetyltransferase
VERPFGPVTFFNPEEHFIVCANILGSPYGTTNPLSKPGYRAALLFSLSCNLPSRDMVKAHQLLPTI